MTILKTLPSSTVRLAVCDARSATMFIGTIAPAGWVHLVETSTLKSRWRDFHEHGRPTKLGMGSPSGSMPRSPDEHREPEELMRRFAREVATWLDQAATETPGSQLYAFAAPRFLGCLRDELGRGSPSIELIRGELCGLRAGEIAAHPSVQTLVRDALKPRAVLVPSRSAQRAPENP